MTMFTQTYKTKHNKDGGVPFSRLQKSQHKIIGSSLSGLQTFPNN